MACPKNISSVVAPHVSSSSKIQDGRRGGRFNTVRRNAAGKLIGSRKTYSKSEWDESDRMTERSRQRRENKVLNSVQACDSFSILNELDDFLVYCNFCGRRLDDPDCCIEFFRGLDIEEGLWSESMVDAQDFEALSWLEDESWKAGYEQDDDIVDDDIYSYHDEYEPYYDDVETLEVSDV